MNERSETQTKTQLEGLDPSREKALGCARAAIDRKAENVKILDLSNLSGFTDFFVLCSGMSDRQVKAIAEGVEQSMKASGRTLLSSEGMSEGRWVLMDFGDVVVHVFLDALREYYDLENLWTGAPRVNVPSEFYGPAASRLS
jgi:ribosome-associated protein